jgi:hypothetical protein
VPALKHSAICWNNLINLSQSAENLEPFRA